MIDIRIEYKKDTRELSLRMRGHAEDGKARDNIVCASASMLAYTLAQCVKFAQAQGKLEKDAVIRLGEGMARIEVAAKEDSVAELLHTFHVIQVGYSLLEHNYSRLVRLKTTFGEAETP